MISFPENTWALILGASSGFGGATALELARNGVNIIGVHLDRGATMPAVEAVLREIRACGVEAHFFNANAADAEARKGVLDGVEAIFRQRPGATFRVMLHSLAFGALRPLVADEPNESVTQAQMEMTLNVMASSLVYWTQDLIRRGLMSSGGRIFAMTSSGSTRVLPSYGAISAAKAALESNCRQLAFELGGRGISVNAIQAGVTDTPALRKIPGASALVDNALTRNPRGRLTTPSDVARLLVLLSTEAAGWINGAVIPVDGGEGAVDVNWLRQQEKTV